MQMVDNAVIAFWLDTCRLFWKLLCFGILISQKRVARMSRYFVTQ